MLIIVDENVYNKFKKEGIYYGKDDWSIRRNVEGVRSLGY